MSTFSDIQALIFDGYLKETLKFDDFVIVIRTLGVAEENFVIDQYKDLPKEYNLMAVVDTVKYAIYSINGAKLDDGNRELIKGWPKRIVIKLFRRYLKLVDRVHKSYKLINDFVKTDDSRLRWSVVKATKTSLNSAIITGNPEFESRGLTYAQQLWIYLNIQQDVVEQNKLDWSRVEYMTDSICSFINPKAMRQVQGNKKLMQEEQIRKEEREEIKQIQDKTRKKIMIENTADDLFDALQRRGGEGAVDRAERVEKLLVKAFQEDEHDKIIREYEEYEFCRQLRIKKENARRAKILHKKKLSQATVIELPAAPKGMRVGYQQVVTIGDDVDVDAKIAEQNNGNIYFVDGIDYSDIVQITSFTLLKNRDQLFKQVTSESDEETIKWIETYIESEKEQTEVAAKIRDLINSSDGQTVADRMLDVRDKVLSGNITATKSSFEDRRKQMLSKIKPQNDEDVDEIRFGG